MHDFTKNVTWNRCIVVGTSSTLLKKAGGKYIDKFDVVIRVNDAPIDHKYVKYTGTKEDVRIGTYPITTHSPYKIYYCHTSWYPSDCWVKTDTDHHPRVSPAFVTTVKRSHKLIKWPSSGLIAFEVANHLCRIVHTVGFGIDTSFSNCTHFYNTKYDSPQECTYRYSRRIRNSWGTYKEYRRTYWHELDKEHLFFST